MKAALGVAVFLAVAFFSVGILIDLRFDGFVADVHRLMVELYQTMFYGSIVLCYTGMAIPLIKLFG
jgi:hypothetical protein